MQNTIAEVYDYKTDDRLEGTASPQLIEASFSEPTGTGAVEGFDNKDGTWGHYNRATMRTHDYRTVYVVLRAIET